MPTTCSRPTTCLSSTKATLFNKGYSSSSYLYFDKQKWVKAMLKDKAVLTTVAPTWAHKKFGEHFLEKKVDWLVGT